MIFFSAGVTLWHISSLICRAVSAFRENEALRWKKVESAGLLVLIWASTIPAVVLIFENCFWIQLGYSSALALATVENIVGLLLSDSHPSLMNIQFPCRCISLGLLSLVPLVHALTGNHFVPSSLEVQYGKMAIYNALGGALYLLQPLERTEIVHRWKPSLYIMHLVVTYNMVTYSRVVFETALGFTT